MLAAWMFFAGRFVSASAAAWSLLPSALIYGVLLVMVVV